MICNHCGKNNPDGASFCEQCGKPMTYTPPVQSEPSTVYFHQTVTPPTPVTNPVPQTIFNPYNSLKRASGKGLIICCLVLSALLGSVPSIILSSVALYLRGQYESSVSYNDIQKANNFVSKIKTLVIIAWIILSVTLLSVLVMYILVLTGGLESIFRDAFSNGTFTKLMF